jgi:hypothetical protein
MIKFKEIVAQVGFLQLKVHPVPELQLEPEAAVGTDRRPRESHKAERCRVVDLMQLHGDGHGHGAASRYPVTTVNQRLLQVPKIERITRLTVQIMKYKLNWIVKNLCLTTESSFE